MKRKALIVDDVELNRELLRDMLEDDFEIVEASNGVLALQQIKEHLDELSVVLLDLMMPEMDGFEVLRTMRKKGWNRKLPVLIISSEDIEAEKICFELGAIDFVRKPFDEMIVKRRTMTNAELFLYKNHLEDKVDEQTKTLLERNRKLKEQAEQLEKNNENIIEILGAAVEARNMESGQHVQRVKDYTLIIAAEMMARYPEYELNETKVNLIAAASPLHDIGKICIPDAILLKPGKLTPEEWEIMKSHTTKGAELLETFKGKWSETYNEYTLNIAKYHHERYDGRGYPEGLAGDDIPICAQIVALADVYDALVNDRVYKKAVPKDEAREMILTGKCGVFNEKVLSCLPKLP